MSALFAGWDGGGTGTTAVCLDEQGREAGRARFGPLNLNGADAATVEIVPPSGDAPETLVKRGDGVWA